MQRYLLTVYVRPQGSLDVFDPHGLIVTAECSDQACRKAMQETRKLGWDCDKMEINRIEEINTCH